MPTWTNNDGLIIKTGVDEAANSKIAEYNFYGGEHVLEIDMRYDNLPAVASNSVNVSDTFRIPAGVQINKVEVITYVDFDSAGDAMTLNVGLTDADGGTTIQDVDALVVAATQTELNTGGTNVTGWVGTAVGTVLAEAALVTWEVDTAAATAGKGVIKIYYTVPQNVSDTLGT
jgi:hypothetical protein